MLPLIIAVSLALLAGILVFLFLTVSPGGFVDFRMGFLLKAAHYLALKNGDTDSHNIEARRLKTVSDIAFVSKKRSGVNTFDVKTPGGIPVRVYKAQPADNLPLIVYFHGGGYVLGDLSYADNLCAAMALKAQSVVISVDYRLLIRIKYSSWETAPEETLRRPYA
jgi:acetyl esterase/lipase